MQSTEEFVEELTMQLVEEWIGRRKSVLAKFQDKGDLYNQLSVTAKGIVNQAVTMGIQFPDSGRYLDMKRKPSKGIGREQIEALKAWAERNLEQIRPRIAKRYENRKIPVSDRRMINDIAWGIARNRTKKGGRRKRWYNRPKGALLATIFDEVAGGLLDHTADQVLKSIKQ